MMMMGESAQGLDARRVAGGGAAFEINSNPRDHGLASTRSKGKARYLYVLAPARRQGGTSR